MTTATKSQTCRIVVINQVLHTRREYVSPQSAADALENHGAVSRAVRFVKYTDCFGDPDEPIGVAVRHGGDVIQVEWHSLTDDPAAARARMREVLAGEWGGQS